MEVYSVVAEEGLVFAGTSNGAYRQVKGQTDWEFAGLEIDSSHVADFVVFENDDDPADSNLVMGVVRYDEIKPNQTSLFKSTRSGEEWIPVEIDLPPEMDYSRVLFLERGYAHPSRVYAYSGVILRSDDRGQSWEIVYDRGGFGWFLSSSRYYPGQIWAGGVVATQSAWLVKSENGGNTWLNTGGRDFFTGDATCFDALLHHADPEKVLVGATTGIQYSNNGGGSWSNIYNQALIYAFEHSSRNPEVIYASGREPGQGLFFEVSRDFGESWMRVSNADVSSVTVHDIASVMRNGREILYLATNRGLYSYTFD